MYTANRIPDRSRIFSALPLLLNVALWFALVGAGVDAGEPQPPPDPAAASIVSGRVTDTDGNAVRGARVVAIISRFDSLGSSEQREIGAVLTNVEGQFELRWKQPSGNYWSRPCIIARAENGSLGLADAAPDSDGRIAIRLEPVRRYRGRLLTSAGEPIGGAHITPILLSDAGNQKGGARKRSCFLPKEIKKEL